MLVVRGVRRLVFPSYIFKLCTESWGRRRGNWEQTQQRRILGDMDWNWDKD